MNKVDWKFLMAVAVLTGSVIGVGIFAIPFAFAKAGNLAGLLFLFGLTFVTVVLNLAYGEIILRTNRLHQIIGYAGIYLGRGAKKVAFFTFVLAAYAALLAYVIVGGEFLANLFSFQFSVSPESLSFIFWFVAALFIAGGLKTISLVDLSMLFLYLGATFLILIWSGGHWHLSNFSLWHSAYWFLPYGILLFALTGSSVALQREVLEGRENQFKKAIVWGTLIPAAIYLIFALAVVAVSGESTSPEAFSGLLPFLGAKAIWAGSLFGLLAIFTSFINLGGVLRESFQYDFRLNRRVSWWLALLPPWLMFMLGVKNFIEVINLAGAVAIGLQTIILIFIYGKVKKVGHRIPEYSLNLPKAFWYGLIALSVFGIGYTLVK